MNGLEIDLRRITAARGVPLFRANTLMRALYVVRSGVIKTCVTNAQGGEQVVGFHVPGEIVGFDGIANGRHACTGVPISDAEVCCLSMSSLYSLADSEPRLHKEISRLMARELAGRRMQLLLFRDRADRRLAWFLLNFAERMMPAVAPRTVLKLTMPRRDIANMLGMQVETVSRMLATLRQDGLIAVLGRHITLLDPAGLRMLIGRS